MKARKYNPSFYQARYPLLTSYDETHPAICALLLHTEACKTCVGKEIEWPDAKEPPIEQAWYSATRGKQQLFSAFAYEFLSYNLVLDGWLELPPEPTLEELHLPMKAQPLMQALLDECRAAAAEANNVRVLPLIQKATEFIDAYHEAIFARFKECQIEWPKTSEQQ